MQKRSATIAVMIISFFMATFAEESVQNSVQNSVQQSSETSQVVASPVKTLQELPLPKVKAKKVKQEKADALGKQLLAEGSDTKKLLKKGANANVVLTNLGDETPFMKALSAQDFTTADLMIAAGTDVNYRTQTDSTPLIAYYLEQNRENIATYLFKRGGATLPDPTASFKSMNFPGLVATAGALEILKALKARGEDILQVYRIQKSDTTASYNLLAFAVFGDQKERLSPKSIKLITYLIDLKIDVNAPLTMSIAGGDSLEATALTLAAMAGESEVIDMLIKAGANLDTKTVVNEKGHTMSFDLSIIPILNNNTALLSQLIKKGVNPNGVVVMKEGNTMIARIPLIIYAMQLKEYGVITQLKEAGADLTQQLIGTSVLGVTTEATTVLEFIGESSDPKVKEMFATELEALGSSESADTTNTK